LVSSACTSRIKETLKSDYVLTGIFVQRMNTDKPLTRANLENFIQSTLRSYEVLKKSGKMIDIITYSKAQTLYNRITNKDSTLTDEELVQFLKAVNSINNPTITRSYPKGNQNDQWFDDFISAAKGTSRTPVTIDNQLVSIGEDLLLFIMINRYQIILVGKEIFQEFLFMASKGQTIEALQKIYSNLKTSDLLAQYQENAIILEEVDKQKIARGELFWSGLLQLGKIIPTALIYLLN